jgi:hypothetical protein
MLLFRCIQEVKDYKNIFRTFVNHNGCPQGTCQTFHLNVQLY